jgi:hypothetical protein
MPSKQSSNIVPNIASTSISIPFIQNTQVLSIFIGKKLKNFNQEFFLKVWILYFNWVNMRIVNF